MSSGFFRIFFFLTWPLSLSLEFRGVFSDRMVWPEPGF